ncbi:hypothetical protein [Thomasclavelia spiroformis]|uniref:hypothetical protein n=1 Tax=Thomasclavelia spiroformis TaxID=29348 RepID=UPI00241CFB87|nr:hypothetical protein [Thomasclavelia spiroformis]MBS6686203.1 hypothetical protein [Thomasclavelia spiroformis]
MEIKDTGKIISIFTTLIGMFSLSNLQESQVEAYVKNNMYSWVLERKREEEVEEMIKSEIRRVSK